MDDKREKQKVTRRDRPEILAFKDWISHRIRSYAFYRSLESRMGKKTPWLTGGILGLVCLLGMYLCRETRQEALPPKHKPPVPVLSAIVQQEDMPLYLTSIGTVTPLESITVKTQVNGRITGVYFQEGQIIKKGALLAQIDPLPYEAQLEQYEGQLIRDEALLGNAQRDLERYEKLYKEDSVSQQMRDTQMYLVQQYKGNVKTGQGLVKSARATIGYCRIISGIDGMVGLRQVNPGNYVQTTDIPLTTINGLSPVGVVFPIPEQSVQLIQEKVRNLILLEVDAFDRKEEKILATGHLLAMDSQIDPTTGTLKLKATFENRNGSLFPNQFVNVRLKVDTLKNCLTVPTAAIQMGREGTFVYVIDEKTRSVSVNKVTVTLSLEGKSSLAGNIKKGQQVVIQGMDKLSEGALVAFPSPDAAPLPQAPA